MKLKNILLALLFLGFVALGIHSITKTDNKLKLKDIEIKSKQSDLQLLEIKYNKLNIDIQTQLDAKVQDQQKTDELQKQKDTLQKQLEQAQKDLQAKADQKAAEKQKLAAAATLSSTAYATSGNTFKDFIYQKESGNNPAAVNAIGCRGLGQACPGSKLPCGSDYACQDAYFTNYAIGRYGSWEAAYYFWIQHHWW